jgi:formylglycine-generating enzyme required for sulfatase activity
MLRIHFKITASLSLLLSLFCFSAHSLDADGVNLEQLKQLSKETQQQWQLLQQALDTSAEYNADKTVEQQESGIHQLREQYQRARTEELIVFDRLVKKEAEIDYQQYLAKREFEVEHVHQCERMASRDQCEEKARLEVLNKAGKQGSSIVINSTTDITTVRSEANDEIENSSEFKEQTNMRSFANIVSYSILDSYPQKTSTEYERLWFIKILVHVSAKRNEFLYQQLVDKHKERFELYLSANSILYDIKTNKRERYVETVERTKIVMIKIPAGQFPMGSEQGDFNEKPVLMKDVSAFYISETEVTKALYDQCIQSKICNGKWKSGAELESNEYNKPQTEVSWGDIQQDFLPWLALKTGRTYRLPTEIEWEYAARAGSETDYFYGDNVSQLCSYANGAKSSSANKLCDDGYIKMSAQVKQFHPNDFGLYDMLGNVSEWTSSCWSLYGKPNLNCRRAVVRGGSWYDKPFYLRSASRVAKNKNARLDTLGFRLAYSD